MDTMTEEKYRALVAGLTLSEAEEAVLRHHFGLPHETLLVPAQEVLRKRILMRVLANLSPRT